MDASLYYASMHGNFDEAKRLIEQGHFINVFAKGVMDTSLNVACRYGHSKVVQLLLENGAEADVKNMAGETALYTACRGWSVDYNFDVVKVLLSFNVNVNKGTSSHLTPLHEACQKNSPGITRLLCEAKANLDCVDNLLHTPLYFACWANNIECVNVLLEFDADLNMSNSNGVSPLMVACTKGHEDIARLLIKKGANVDYYNKHGSSPLSETLFHNRPKITLLLVPLFSDDSLFCALKRHTINNTAVQIVCDELARRRVRRQVTFLVWASREKHNPNSLSQLPNDLVQHEIAQIMLSEASIAQERNQQLQNK